MKKKFWYMIGVTVWILSMLLQLTACVQRASAVDLMEGIRPGSVQGKAADEVFCNAQTDLSLKLLRSTVDHSEEGNLLISPLSIQLALAMTANGAGGQTRQEMESLLGGGIPLELLNEYLYSYVKELSTGENCKLNLANSIWFRDDEGRLQVEQSFLQKNGDYYGARAFRSAFDDQTLKDMNNWVEDNTDGMIDKILDEISNEAMLYLINALTFDGKWQLPYKKSDVWEGTFHKGNGEDCKVAMMHSSEPWYLENEKTIGFMKEYMGGDYIFAAILPKEGTDIYDFVNSLTSAELRALIENPQYGSVQASLPKFSFDYELTMNEALIDLGLQTAFHGELADFSSMAHSSDGNLYIGDVLHKTHVSVDEEGTKAAAVTKVEMVPECAIMSQWKVVLDRPFLFMILDQSSKLPVFMGIVTDPSA